MAKDTKINSRKEKSSGNLEYLGIKHIRFHFNCTQCSAGIVLRTNPQLSRVLCESDATLFCGDQLPGRLPYGLEEESNWHENRDEILAQRIFMMKRERGRRLSQLFWSFSSRKMNSRAEISKVARDCSDDVDHTQLNIKADKVEDPRLQLIFQMDLTVRCFAALSSLTTCFLTALRRWRDGSRDDGGRDDNCINGGGGESGGNELMAMSSGGSGEAVVVILMTR
ncbi:PREDICTED: coiled-coil [Prunus dulcis]|uniref:PREDICTED: coiled-coil n=1 Tax=Prunus dulcis TaxID=3755 RepID=A0A5E4EA37_PRUDU|nr:PREDICTED: coiled-coil [Prunus dulcis]